MTLVGGPETLALNARAYSDDLLLRFFTFDHSRECYVAPFHRPLIALLHRLVLLLFKFPFESRVSPAGW